MFVHAYIVWSFCEARDLSLQFFYLPFFADVNAIIIYLSRTIYHVPSTPRGLTERTYTTFGKIHTRLLNTISLSVYPIWVGRIKARTAWPGKDFGVTSARDWIDFGFSYATSAMTMTVLDGLSSCVSLYSRSLSYRWHVRYFGSIERYPFEIRPRESPMSSVGPTVSEEIHCLSARKSHGCRDRIECKIGEADSVRRSITQCSTWICEYRLARRSFSAFFASCVESSFRSSGLARIRIHPIKVYASIEHKNVHRMSIPVPLCLCLALSRRSRCLSCHLSASERQRVYNFVLLFFVLRLLLRHCCLLLIARIVSPAWQ